jgi:hypothetical protein
VARAAPLAAGAWSLGVLAGCPQLLDDAFEVEPALPGVGLDSTQHTPQARPDAGATGPGLDPADAVDELGTLVAHRYAFEGSGNRVLDSVGTAHGTSIGTSLDASGTLYLSGDEQYVELPAGIISGFDSVSVECWVNWAGSSGSSGYSGYWRGDGSGTWQSLFTFGSSDQGVGRQGVGTQYIYLTPQSPSAYGNSLRAGYSLTGFNTESYVSGDRALPLSSDRERGTQVVYVLDAAQRRMSIFIDGALEISRESAQQVDLSAIPDVNNWLGRSLFLEAAEFEGDLLDVRIYGVALSAAQVELSFDLGPDAEL